MLLQVTCICYRLAGDGCGESISCSCNPNFLASIMQGCLQRGEMFDLGA